MFIVFEYDYDLGHSVIGLCTTLDDAKDLIGSNMIEVWSGTDKIATYKLYNDRWSKSNY